MNFPQKYNNINDLIADIRKGFTGNTLDLDQGELIDISGKNVLQIQSVDAHHVIPLSIVTSHY